MALMLISILLHICILSNNNMFIRMELIQIHTITRHGQRSPCFSFPNDPHSHLWKNGLCQITDKGIEQLKEVGLFIRDKYHNLIPKKFHKKEVYVRSSDTDRTIISALAAMKSLFNNQLIPIHTVPKRYDYLLKMCSICPFHSNLLNEEFRSEKYKFLIQDYQSLLKELEDGTGLNNVDIFLGFRVCDAVTVWNQLNLTFPNWVNASTVSKCEELANLKFVISYSNNILTKFRGGPLLNSIIENMIKRAKGFIKGHRGMKMFNFFTHDSTMSAFLGHLQSFNGLKPPLASLIIIELYYFGNIDWHNDDALSNFNVRFLFRNNTKIPPSVLNLPECEDGMCRLDVLIRTFKYTFVKNIPEECGISNYVDHWFASNQVDQDTLLNKGFLNLKQDDKPNFIINLLVPLLITEIIVLCIFYKLFKR